jgi:glycosyltransferase involved in cell wall biosynthesis
MPPPPPVITVVVKGYPRVSETFVAQEVAALERCGLALALASLRRPYDALRHPVHAQVRAAVRYLPEYLHDSPGRVLAAHAACLAQAPLRYLGTALAWLADLARDPTRSRIRRFGQAGVLAAELPAGTRLLYAHFLHTPASVTHYAARLRGLPFALSGHAKDVWTTPAWELAAKLRAAHFTVTCTAAARARLAALAPEARVELLYHGLDRALFAPPAATGSARDGGDPADPVRLLAVGRFQPKKGLDVVLDAVARLRRHARLTVVGYGPLETALRAQAARLGLDGRVTWTGPLDQPAVRAQYRAHDLFVLAPRVVAGGDRDGLPNVVVEALSQGLPVVATAVGALGELIHDGQNGRLVPPDDPAALAAAVDALAGDPAARQRLGRQALADLEAGWDLDAGAARLAEWLRAAAAAAPAPRPGRHDAPAPVRA